MLVVCDGCTTTLKHCLLYLKNRGRFDGFECYCYPSVGNAALEASFRRVAAS
mgnify:CR=1 FL=1